MEGVRFSGLKAEMARRGETNKILADLLEISESSMSRRLSGEVNFSVGEVEALCNHYEKNAYELNLIRG